MKKQKYIKYAILIITIITSIIILLQPYAKADFNPYDYNIHETDSNSLINKFGGVISILSTIGSYASVILLVVVGIRFMAGSLEDKAEYKQRMTPYVLGAVFVFAITRIVDIIRTIGVDLSSSGSVDEIGGKVITIVSVIGSIISVIILICLGIKYMMGSTEDKADFKSSMMPYIIGATVVFAASSLAGVIYRLAIQF